MEKMQEICKLQQINPVNVKNEAAWKCLGLQPPSQNTSCKRCLILIVEEKRVIKRERQKRAYFLAFNDLHTPMGDKTKVSDY